MLPAPVRVADGGAHGPVGADRRRSPVEASVAVANARAGVARPSVPPLARSDGAVIPSAFARARTLQAVDEPRGKLGVRADRLVGDDPRAAAAGRLAGVAIVPHRPGLHPDDVGGVERTVDLQREADRPVDAPLGRAPPFCVDDRVAEPPGGLPAVGRGEAALQPHMLLVEGEAGRNDAVVVDDDQLIGRRAPADRQSEVAAVADVGGDVDPGLRQRQGLVDLDRLVGGFGGLPGGVRDLHAERVGARCRRNADDSALLDQDETVRQGAGADRIAVGLRPTDAPVAAVEGFADRTGDDRENADRERIGAGAHVEGERRRRGGGRDGVGHSHREGEDAALGRRPGDAPVGRQGKACGKGTGGQREGVGAGAAGRREGRGVGAPDPSRRGRRAGDGERAGDGDRECRRGGPPPVDVRDDDEEVAHRGGRGRRARDPPGRRGERQTVRQAAECREEVGSASARCRELGRIGRAD